MDDIQVTPVEASTATVDKIKLKTEKPKKTAADWVREMRMSSSVNKTTTGVETDRVTPDLLLATANKLLKISRREQEADPKDSLEFQRFYGPAEYFAEHVLRDGSKLGRNLLWKATNKGNLDFMQSGALDAHVSDVFYDSKLAQMVDASSPLETVDAAYKTTRIGEGGVGDISAAPDEMRTVQASYFGYLDPVRSPERKRVGLDMYMTKHCMKGSDGKLYQKFINAHTGKEELVDSVTAAKSVVACPEMMDVKTKSIFALGGPTGVRIVPRASVDYFLPRADDAYSMASNLVTMPSGVKEMRLLMGCLHPNTTVLTFNNKKELAVSYAKSLSSDNNTIPGCGNNGVAVNYPLRNTIAKFPQKTRYFKKIVLKSGRTLITSNDHKWPVLVDDKIVLKQAKDIKAGDIALRTTFKDIPNRRTFINGILINKDIAYLLGLICRSVTKPEDNKIRVVYNEIKKPAVENALNKLGIKDYYYYINSKEFCLGIRDTNFIEWIEDNIHIDATLRCIPPCILSANANIVAYFIDGYCADETLVGIDGNEDMWILEIPNNLMRDSLAIALSKIGVDTLYRDAIRVNDTSIALKLNEVYESFGDMIKDPVKAVIDGPKTPIMIDIDINDNLYATANGIITHNSKYPLQAISLEQRETPLVRGLDEATGKDMSTLVGKYLGARFAKQGGVVSAVRKDRIDVIYDDGTKGSVSLYQNFPCNTKGYINNTPQVKAGQSFKKGDILASSNYTDDKGIAATGTNLRSGWISWKGGTYEDAVVLSESAAKKLTSTTMYKTSVDLDKTISLGKQNYVTWKPSEYTKDQMEQLDDNGIVKPGSVLKKGDPMILAVQTTEPSPGTMGKRILTDLSETWEHNHPGIVTDVVRSGKGVKVFATVTAPAELGDKVAGCYDDDTEVFTKTAGFKKFIELTQDDEVAVLGQNGKATFEKPYAYINRQYDGYMYYFSNKHINFMVTPDHRMAYTTRNNYEEKHNKVINVCKAEDFNMPAYIHSAFEFSCLNARNTIDKVILPVIKQSKKCIDKNNIFNVVDFASFLGLWLAEGHISEERNAIYITQDKKTHKNICDEIELLLNRLGLHWKYCENRRYCINNKNILIYLKQLGKSNTKYIPEDVFSRWPETAWKELLNWHYKGDGDKTGTTKRVASVSERLIRDLQRLHILLGHSCTVSYIDGQFDDINKKALLKRNYKRYKLTEQEKSAHIINKIGKIKKVEYHGAIHCVSTKAGIILVCRNGKPMWCGNCYGNKGVVSQILPDDQMPQDKNGKALDILLSPLGLVSRTNSSQIYEALLGKIAKKTGKPEIVPAFYNGDLYEYTANKLKQNHVTADDDLVDPETGRIIPKVVTGYSYIHKLKHLSESKMSARGSDGYDAEGVPAGEGFDKSKRFGGLEISALVGHNAFDVIKDAKLIRGQSNADFWREVRTGGIPTIPGEPLVHKKFFAHLIGSGINIRKTPKGISCFTLSNDDVKELAGPRELKSRDTYEAKNFRPIDGGLFGQDIFGINGDKWGYIQLDEPMPNPVMEEPLARLLRIPEKDLIAVAEGKKEVDGMKNSVDLKKRLATINLENEARTAKQELKDASVSKKDNALKRYVAIERMRRQGVTPDQYMLDRIPVVPPVYRPISAHGGLTMVADSNYLYAQLMDARDDMREAKDLPEEYQQQARENIYRNWKELTGLYDPENAKLKNKHVQGLLKWALGDSPKWSSWQRKVVGATVDTVGRGVVIPNPRLRLNELGIPKDMAFGIMAPFVERALVKRGYTPIEAMKQVKKQTQQATDILLEVMKTHPVLMNRAPSLHKLNVMAFNPILTTGNAIHVNPSIVSPFAMDFDGDSIQGIWSVKVEREELVKNLKKYKILEKSFLQSSVFGVLYDKDANEWRLENTEKDIKNVITKQQKVRFSNAVVSPSELPVIPGSEVKKSNTVTEWDVVPGIYVDTLGLNGESVIAPVTKVSRHEDLHMLDVAMSVCGRNQKVVTASDDHSLIAINRETLELEKIKPENSIGALIPRVRTDATATAQYCERYLTLDKQYPANYDLGVFLGIMLGDGWVNCDERAYIACCNESLQKYIIDLVDNKLALPMTKNAELHSYAAPINRFSQNDLQRINVYLNKECSKALHTAIGDGAWNKRIPAASLCASHAHMTGILMGLLATDGTVSYAENTKAKSSKCKTIIIHTTSPELRDGIQILCSRIGIRTAVTPYVGTHSKRPCYAVSLSVVDVARERKHHATLFTIPMEEKQNTLEKICADLDTVKEPHGGATAEIVPFPSALAAELSWAKVGNPASISSCRKHGYMTLTMAKRVASILRDKDWTQFKEYGGLPNTLKRNHTPEQAKALVDAWCSIVDSSDKIAWMCVDSVKESDITEGWDCTVPGPYTFTLWDGTVVQDTVNIHVPVSDNARKNARERMFPERNLIAMKNRSILYKPEKEYQQGLFIATRMKSKPNVRPATFRSIDEAKQARRDGIIDVDDPIIIQK